MRNLNANLEAFKKFNANRKLKGAVKAVIAINKIKNLMGNTSGSTGNASPREGESPE